jgi:hypothetical protein
MKINFKKAKEEDEEIRKTSLKRRGQEGRNLVLFLHN